MCKTTPSSDLEKNKQITRNFIHDVLDRHDVEAADKYFPEHPMQFKQFLSGFFQRFPDSRTTITGNATDNQTGKRVTMKAADLYRIENGTIAEHWDVVDRSEII